MGKYLLGIVLILLLIGFYTYQSGYLLFPQEVSDAPFRENLGGIGESPHPLTIEALRNERITGSDLTIVDTIPNGSNYSQFIASYESEGNTIYGLLTIPLEEKPESGFPLIIFNHGYIPPSEYQTTVRYESYIDGFARNGYVVFKPDYRGHGNSEGEAEGGYGSNAYTIDVLNALETMKRHPDVDETRIGMWGHSMGGHITLRSMVVSDDIDAGVIWAGVVSSYPDLVSRWRRNRNSNVTISPTPGGRRRWRDSIREQFGTPEQNPAFWDSISATSFLKDISGPIQLHHGTNDESVPVEFSQTLKTRMEEVGKPVELYEYEGDNHNISFNFGTAMERSIEFFDKYVKNGE